MLVVQKGLNFSMVYEIEPITVNNRVQYTSYDGRVAMWYGDCGLWVIGYPEARSVLTDKFLSRIALTILCSFLS